MHNVCVYVKGAAYFIPSNCMSHSFLNVLLFMTVNFLNQACAWFLKIDPVWIVSMRVCLSVCVCVPAPKAINN